MTVDLSKGRDDSSLAADLGVTYTVPRVNLLPPEITAARALRRTQAGLAGAVLLVVAAIAAVFLLSQQRADDAAEALAAEQTRTAALTAQQAEFARVPVILAQVEAAQAATAQAMSTDVLWYRYLNELALTYPSDIWLGDLTATVAGPGAVATVAADPLATPSIGLLTFTGTGLDMPDVADWLDVLDGTPGFADAWMTTATRTEEDGRVVVDWSTSVVLTDEALSQRFTQEAG